MPAPVVDFGQAQNLVNQQKADFQGLLNQQNSTQQGLFNQYSQASNAQPKLVNTLNTAQQQRGLPQLQNSINLFNNQVGDTKGLLDRLDENTKSRTEGTNANQAYLDRLRASEGGQLNTTLSRLSEGLQAPTSAYDLASRDIGQLMSATADDRTNSLHPLEMQINAMGDNFSRQITGFTQGRQDELNTLMSKLQAQQALNDREWQQAADLAKQEAAFQQQRKLASDDLANNKNLINFQQQAQTPPPPQAAANVSADERGDSEYLGRLKDAYSNNPQSFNTILNSLKTGNAQAQRRYALAVHMGMTGQPQAAAPQQAAANPNLRYR